MFIGWISQILPLMDKPVGEAIEGILHSIAVDYPQVEFPLLCTHELSDVCIFMFRQSLILSRSANMTTTVITLMMGSRDWVLSISNACMCTVYCDCDGIRKWFTTALLFFTDSRTV